jgi:hypothetical protein
MYILAGLIIFFIGNIFLGIIKGIYYLSKFFGFIVSMIGQIFGVLLIPFLFIIFVLYLIF